METRQFEKQLRNGMHPTLANAIIRTHGAIASGYFDKYCSSRHLKWWYKGLCLKHLRISEKMSEIKSRYQQDEYDRKIELKLQELEKML